jgi:NAD(P)H-quinone oxidoreductase subunit 4
MLLAGILLKMGGYALVRINMDMLPNAHYYFAPLLVIVGVINIIYAALTSFAQRNLKRKIAYSSVSHMGFVLIGLGSLTESGLSGAMLQMISHGLIGASLFFLAGVTYDRTRTLILEDLGGLAVQMPKVFAMFTAVSLASLALPGMSGFISELMIFLGFVTSESYSYLFREVFTLLAAIGIILTPIYLLSMLRQVFYGSKRGSITHSRGLIDAGPREIFVVVCLMIPMIGIGLYPKMVTQIYEVRTNAVVEHIHQSRDYVATKSTLWT